MNTVILLAGGNLGNVRENLVVTKTLIREKIGPVISASDIHESEPWGFEAEQSFFNQAYICQTSLSANDVLREIQAIETRLGRKHLPETARHWKTAQRHYQSRTMDIDILFFNDQIIETDHLCIPHPLLQQRMFVLKPLAEIAGHWQHPVLKKTVCELKKALEEKTDSV